MNRTVNALEAAGSCARDPSETDARQRLGEPHSARATTSSPRRGDCAPQWFHDRLDASTDDERAALEAVRPVLRKLADS